MLGGVPAAGACDKVHNADSPLCVSSAGATGAKYCAVSRQSHTSTIFVKLGRNWSAMSEPSTVAQIDDQSYRGRWRIITVLVFAVLSYGLQMYSIVPAFFDIQRQYSLDLPQVSLFVSLFFFGYAAAHVPVGFAAAAYGAKTVTVVGTGLLAVSSIGFAFADNYVLFLLLRAIGGAGAAAIIGAGYQLAAAWAREHQMKLVIGGLMNGLGFTGGAATALYLWTLLIDAIGWRLSTLIAGLLGVAVTIVAAAVLRAPAQLVELHGGHLSWRGTFQCLRSRNMWMIGVGSIGAYGAVFTISQIGPGYAVSELGFSEATAGLLATTLLVLGVPGALLGGLVGDRVHRFLPSLKVPAALIVVLLFVLPLAGTVASWFVLGGIGFLGMVFFAAFATSPAEYPDEVPRQDFATALGLILTLSNIGAVIFPYIYAVTTDATSATTGWWVLAAISAVSWSGFVLAREPRRIEV